MTPHASPTSTGWHPDYDGIARRPYVESDNEGYVKGEEVWCVTQPGPASCLFVTCDVAVSQVVFRLPDHPALVIGKVRVTW